MIYMLLRAIGLRKPKKVEAWPVIPPFKGQFAADLATLEEAERQAYERTRPLRERYEAEMRQMHEENRRRFQEDENGRRRRQSRTDEVGLRRHQDDSWTTPAILGGLNTSHGTSGHATCRADNSDNDTRGGYADTPAASDSGSCGE